MSKRRRGKSDDPIAPESIAAPERKRARKKDPERHRLSREDDPTFREAVAASRRQRRMEDRTKLREYERERRRQDDAVRKKRKAEKAAQKQDTAPIPVVEKKTARSTFPASMTEAFDDLIVEPVEFDLSAREAVIDIAPRVTKADRRARKLALRRRLKRLQRVLIVLAIVVCAALWYFVPRLSVFAIHHIDVIGASAVADTVVRNNVEDLFVGKTIYTVNEDAMTKKLNDLPFVRGVHISHHFPNTIAIEIEEYTPLAFGIGDNTGWLVASDGRVLSHARLADWQDRVPVVRLNEGTIEPGKRVDNEPALRLLLSIPPTFPGNFRTIDRTGEGYVGTLTTGVRVKFGDNKDFQRKLKVAQRMLVMTRSTQTRNIDYLDVSVYVRPVYCPLNRPCGTPTPA